MLDRKTVKRASAAPAVLVLPVAVCPAADPAPPTNLASGSRATASSSYHSDFSGTDCAVDGNPDTWWRHLSRDTRPWLQLDLGEPKTVGALVLQEYLRHGDYRIRGYRLEASLDGDVWTLLDANDEDRPDTDAVGPAKVVAFPQRPARFLRFTISARDPAEIAGLFDFQVYRTETAEETAREAAGLAATGHTAFPHSLRVTGSSLPRVGYSMPRVIRGTDKLAWLRYSKVNAVRYWISPPRHVPAACVSEDEVPDLATFERLRTRLRNNPQSHTYIDWDRVQDNMTFMVDRRNRTAYTIDWTLQGIRDLDIEICAELNHGRCDDTWQIAWRNWQQIYATAFHLARQHGVTLFQTPNDPDHPHQRSLHGQPKRMLRVLRLYSDAIRSAVADVNRLEGPSPAPRLAGAGPRRKKRCRLRFAGYPHAVYGLSRSAGPASYPRYAQRRASNRMSGEALTARQHPVPEKTTHIDNDQPSRNGRLRTAHCHRRL